ncbi:MAG: hypothetical protein J5J06_15045 [Phycisphaerae bacterium]|nr:hypothetical protein [Phycisphaerae bacterium]
MNERFSDRARHAFALANREADILGHDYLAPAHLLLGLIAEGSCVATEALRLLDVELGRVREEVRRRLSAGEATTQIGRRAQTKELKDVIRFAIEESRGHNHKYVGTEHLVLGLVAQGNSIAATVLSEQGVKLEALREKALGLLRSEVHADHDLVHSRHGHLEWMHQQELAKAFRSPSFWHVLILAVDSANRMGAGEIEPEHLLLALLRDENNPVAKLLSEKGVTAGWVRERLASGADTQ